MKKPPSSELYYTLGEIRRDNKKDTNKAIQTFKEGIKKPPSSNLYRALGDTYYYNLTDYTKAIKYYKLGISFKPTADLYRALGDLYNFGLGMKEKENHIQKILYLKNAIEAYEKALDFNESATKRKIGNRIPQLYYVLGDVYNFNLAWNENDDDKKLEHQRNALNAYDKAFEFGDEKVNEKIKGSRIGLRKAINKCL